MATLSLRQNIGMVLGGFAFLILPLAVFVPKALAPLIGVTALVAAIGCYQRSWLTLRQGHLALALGAMAVVAAISFLWSQTPEETVKTSIGLAATFLSGAILFKVSQSLDPGQRRGLLNGLIFGGAAGYLLLGFELSTDLAILRGARTVFDLGAADNTRLNITLKPGNSVAAIYLWPWGAALWQRYSPKIALSGIAITLVVTLFGVADVPKVALGVGVVVLGLGYLLARAAPLIFGLVAGIGILVMPMIPGALPDPLVTGKNLTFLSHSVVHRLAIWQVTASHISEKPLIGFGFDTARSLYSPADGKRQDFLPDRPEKTFFNAFEPIPLHPHNAVLQIWLEMGALGALILIGVLIGVVRAIARLEDRINQATCLGAAASALVIASASFGAWQSWWLSALFLVGSAMVAVTSNPHRSVSRPLI